MKARGGRFCAAVAALVVVAVSGGEAAANNGINQIGFGAESALMAGADTATTRDTTALNTNPAGLARISGGRADVYAAAAYFRDAAHVDALGNDRQISNKVVPVGDAGLAFRLGPRWVAGAGVFAQGGVGAVYGDLLTPFATRDELSALFGVAKLSAGLSWQVTDTLDVGVAVAEVVASARQKVFPGTSSFNALTPAASFFGTSLEGVRGARPGYRFGLQYRPVEGVTLGASFANRVSIPLEDGRLRVNMSDAGLGIVTYRNARLEGLAVPREISFGVAWQVTGATLVSAKLSRLGWAKAMDALVLEASDPDLGAAPATVRQVQDLSAHDRTVYAVGLRHELSDRLTLLAGFNYSRRPLDDASLSPIFAPIGERHLTFGAVAHVTGRLVVSCGIEYLLPVNVTYTNPSLPLPPGTSGRLEYIAVHAMASFVW